MDEMEYKKDNIVNAKVTGIENYGIFVTLDNGYKGLIHISEISHSYVNNINDYINIDDIIKVKILEVDDKLLQAKLTIKDVDYKMNNKKNKLIKETGTGFGILLDNLEKWINTKMEVINNKKK